MKKIKKSEIDDMKKRLEYLERSAIRFQKSSDYYQQELERAHALLGRIIHQISERWDTVNLTKYFPTDNLWGKKSISNPSGE